MKKLAISLFVPIIVLFALVMMMENDIARGHQVKVAIEGYDPRDLLRGHYVNFRYKWKFDEEKTAKFLKHDSGNITFNDTYLCIEESGTVYPINEAENDEGCTLKALGTFLSLNNKEYDFNFGIEKFYVAEDKALALEKMVMQGGAELLITANSQKRAIIVDLLLNGKPWKEVIR